eukprot:gene25506-biopygen15037
MRCRRHRNGGEWGMEKCGVVRAAREKKKAACIHLCVYTPSIPGAGKRMEWSRPAAVTQTAFIAYAASLVALSTYCFLTGHLRNLGQQGNADRARGQDASAVFPPRWRAETRRQTGNVAILPLRQEEEAVSATHTASGALRVCDDPSACQRR